MINHELTSFEIRSRLETIVNDTYREDSTLNKVRKELDILISVIQANEGKESREGKQ